MPGLQEHAETLSISKDAAGTYYAYPGDGTKGDLEFFPDFVEGQLQCAANPGGTNPTLDVTLESSLDGTTWATLLTFTQITTSAGTGERKGAVRSATVLPGRFFRGKFVVGGTPAAAYTPKLALLFKRP